MNLDSYSKYIKKKTERLLKKMFGYKDVKIALHELKLLKNKLENITEKSINEIRIEDLKKFNNGCYDFAKYRTLKKITDLYLESVCLNNFTIKEYKEYCK